MQEVFEKIIEKLESEYEDIKEIYKRTKDMSFYFTFQGVNKAIEIVKKESEKRYHGHFGCNTNGEHERCDGCGLTDCKNRNKIWFGAVGDGTDTNVGSNVWIPCSERLPKTNESVLCWAKSTARGGDVCFVGSCHNGFWFLQSSADTHSFPGQYVIVAWHPLPEPYKPKFVQQCTNPSSKEEIEEFNKKIRSIPVCTYTNADRIRSLSDEELAVFLCKVKADYQWEEHEFPSEEECGEWEEWLQSEVEV